MNKVCHLTSVHGRYDARILKKECVSLANAGYDVTLIVADNKEDEIYRGVKIISIDFHPKNRLDRILNSKKKMLKKALDINADVYHFHDPELIPIGLNLVKMGKKVIYDSHEDYPLDIRYKKKWLPHFIRPIISALFFYYEMWAAKKFSAVISVTPQITRRFLDVNNKSYVVTNYPILINSAPVAIAKKSESKFTICFAGLLAMPWFQEKFIEAIQDLDVNYITVGPIDGQYLKFLMSVDKNKKVEYKGIVPQEEVFCIYENASVGMSIASYDPTDYDGEGSLGITKLFEYMIFGLPVICTDYTLWKEIVNKWKCGICVSPNDTKAIHDAVKYLLDNPEVVENMGKNAKDAVLKEYNWSMQEKILLAAYVNL
ncbi:glycosyltransferase [Cloacibacillus porcorum]|jgi:glycosyltransferase involved in cell wall biosynthesis|uniref:glycosyltransferase n=1 Tax=Cloacibacillus porcorum TaxID=1197717 RepID=UPI003F07CE5F